MCLWVFKCFWTLFLGLSRLTQQVAVLLSHRFMFDGATEQRGARMDPELKEDRIRAGLTSWSLAARAQPSPTRSPEKAKSSSVIGFPRYFQASGLKRRSVRKKDDPPLTRRTRLRGWDVRRPSGLRSPLNWAGLTSRETREECGSHASGSHVKVRQADRDKVPHGASRRNIQKSGAFRSERHRRKLFREMWRLSYDCLIYKIV